MPATPPTLTKAALTLGTGLAGGSAFAAAHLPMPWLLGAIFGSALAAIGGLRIGLSRTLRNSVLVVIGLLTGSSIHASTLAHVAQWPVSMTAVALYVLLCTASLYALLRRFAGFDRVTAYFASAPGGLMAMTVVGGAMGGRERSIALTHSIRVVLVVFTVIFSYHLLLGVQTANPGSTAPLEPGHLALLAATGLAGWLLGLVLRLPAGAMIGPLLAMAALQLAGLHMPAIPQPFVLAAEVVLGSGIGSDFTGVRPGELLRGAVLSIIATGWMLALAALFSLSLIPLTGLPFDTLFLAFSPGGLSGVTLIAVALGIEPAFVTVHNLFRIMLITLAGPPIFRLLEARAARRKPPAP